MVLVAVNQCIFDPKTIVDLVNVNGSSFRLIRRSNQAPLCTMEGLPKAHGKSELGADSRVSQIANARARLEIGFAT